MTKGEVKRRITKMLRRHMTAAEPASFDMLPKKLTAGKLYEAYVLAMVSRELVKSEGYSLRLVNDEFLPLQSTPLPINRSRPRVELRDNKCRAEMWTDVEFLSLSYSMRGGGPPEPGEYHELDIAVVEPGLNGRPPHDKIWLAVECKNTGYNKGLLKEILGIRRELSLLYDPPQTTAFQKWPRDRVPAKPPSCLVVYCTDQSVMDYARPGETFGIDFRHEELIL